MRIQICTLWLAASTAIYASDLSGDWEVTAKYLGDITYGQISLKADGEKLTGKLFDLTLAGTLHGDELTFTATRPEGGHFGDFKGAPHDDVLNGTALWSENRQVV